jgi:hypothetical protein
MRMTAGTLAVVLFLVMLYLFFGNPQLSFKDNPATVSCGSVAGAGWPSAEWLDTATVHHVADSLPPSGVASEAVPGILRDCDQRRTTFVGFMALLAVPTVLLGALAMWLPRKAGPAEPKVRKEFAGE